MSLIDTTLLHEMPLDANILEVTPIDEVLSCDPTRCDTALDVAHPSTKLFNMTLLNMTLLNMTLLNMTPLNMPLFNMTLLNMTLLNMTLLNMTLLNMTLLNMTSSNNNNCTY